MRICNGIIWINSQFDIPYIAEYNEAHQDYLVIYRGDSTTSHSVGRRLKYYDIDNASVVVEQFKMNHSCAPESHFGTLLRETGKIFLVSNEIDWKALRPFKQRKIHRQERGQHERWRVYPIKVKVTASERQQKAIVELID
jgi:hypothetical protein